MHLKDHEKRGKAVILTDEDIQLLDSKARNTRERIAFGLGARCGLRSEEIVQVTPGDVIDGPAGSMIKVEHGKGDKYRETPLPRELELVIDVYSEGMDRSSELIDVSKRSMRYWIKEVAELCSEESGDDRWQHLSTHDLRRSWGNLLVEQNVEHGQIMEWGGWENWETFRESYLGRYTPERQRQEREKVDWLV